MDFSKLSYEQVKGKADELNNSATQMDSLLNEVRDLFDRIGNDDVWSGTAASTTKDAFNRLSAKFPEFVTAVTDCSRYLMSAVENYQSVDHMVTGAQ